MAGRFLRKKSGENVARRLGKMPKEKYVKKMPATAISL